MSEKKELELIPWLDAINFPQEVLDYCEDNDIPIHCDSDIVRVEDDGNVLAEWIKETYDYEFVKFLSFGDKHGYGYFAVSGT